MGKLFNILVVILVVTGPLPVQCETLSCSNCVGTRQLKRNSVKTAKIKDSSVTLSKLAEDSVSSEKITDSAVTEEKVATGAISKAKLGTDVKALGLENVTIITAGDFNPDGSNINCFREDDSFSWSPGGGMGNCCLQAPVRLPNGARVTTFEVTALCADVNPIEVDLQFKIALDDSEAIDLATVQFTQNASIQTLTDTIDNQAIDTTTQFMYIRTCLSNVGDVLYNARVFYE